MAIAGNKPVDNSPNDKYRIYGFDETGKDVNIYLSKIKELVLNEIQGEEGSSKALFKFSLDDNIHDSEQGYFTTGGISTPESVTKIRFSNIDSNGNDVIDLVALTNLAKNNLVITFANSTNPNNIFTYKVLEYNTDSNYAELDVELYKAITIGSIGVSDNYVISLDTINTLMSDMINDGDGESPFATEDKVKELTEEEPKAIHSKDMFIGDIAFVKPLSFPISNLEIEGVSQNTEVTIGSNIYPNVAYTNIGRYEKEPVTLTLPINSVVYIYVTLEGEIEFSETNTATGVPLYQVTTDESKIIEDGIVDLRPINDYDFYVGGRLVLGNDASTGNEAVRYSQMSDALAEKAEKNGDETQVFKVADSVDDYDAVNKRQLDAEKVRISDLEATQNSGASERYDTKALLEANGSDDVTKVYRVDSDTYANNGNYKYDGASYVKTSNLIDSTNNVDDSDQTKVAEVSVVKKSTSLVFDNSADTPVKVRSFIKSIDYLDLDITKQYTLGVVRKNISASSNLWDVNIYEWVGGAFGASVARFNRLSYTPTSDIEVIDLGVGGVTKALATVDWSQLDDEDSFTGMGYSVGGLDNSKIQLTSYYAKENLDLKADKYKVYNKAIFTDGAYYDASGSVVPQFASAYSAKIDLDSLSEVIFKSEINGSSHTVFFEADGITVADTILNTGEITTVDLISNSNYKYIAISTAIDEIQNSFVYVGDIYTVPKDVDTNKNNIATNTANIATNAEVIDGISLRQYPFDENADIPETLKNAVLDVKLFDANSSIDYTVTVFRRNIVGESNLWDIKIFEWVGGAFGNSIRWFKNGYTPTEDVETISLTGVNGWSGVMVIDWSQVADGYSVTSQNFSKTGLQKTVVNKTTTPSPSDVFDILLPSNMYMPQGKTLYVYDDSTILNYQKFDTKKYTLMPNARRYKDYCILESNDGVVNFAFRDNTKLSKSYRSLSTFLTKSITINELTAITGGSKTVLPVADSYLDIAWGDGVLEYIKDFATADGNTITFTGTRTSYGNLGECYQGWNAQDFYENFVPSSEDVNPNGNPNGGFMRSPFVFSTDNTVENSYFSFSEYLSTNSLTAPDVLMFFLGMNGGDGTYIDLMITNIRSTHPDIEIIVCMIPPAEKYRSNLDSDTRQIGRENQNINYLSLFDGRELEKIRVAPTSASFNRYYGLIGGYVSEIQFNEDGFTDDEYRTASDHHPTATGAKGIAYVAYLYAMYTNY